MQKISSFHLLIVGIQSILEPCDQTGHTHFWPWPPKKVLTNDQIFHWIKKPCFVPFLAHFPNFKGIKCFYENPENPTLSCTTSYWFLAAYQNLEKTNLKFQENALTDSMDRPYFIRPFCLPPGFQKEESFGAICLINNIIITTKPMEWYTIKSQTTRAISLRKYTIPYQNKSKFLKE